MLVEGGVSVVIAAMQRDTVGLRTLYQMFHHATQLSNIPTETMFGDMHEIMKTPMNKHGKRSEYYRNCAGKYQVVSRSLIFSETCKIIADYGNDPKLRPSNEALASSFLLRLLAPGGILDTGIEPDLGGLEKEDVDNENEITQGYAIQDLIFEALEPLKHILNFMDRILYFHPSFVKHEYSIRPERFGLDGVLLYDREEEGTPIPLATENTKAHTVSKGGKKYEILFNSNGIIKVSRPITGNSQRATSLIPEELMLPYVVRELIMKKPPPGEAFQAQLDYIRKQIKVKKSDGGELAAPATPENEKPASRGETREEYIKGVATNMDEVLTLIAVAKEQKGGDQEQTFEKISALVVNEKKRAQEVIDLTTPKAKRQKKAEAPMSTEQKEKAKKDEADGE